LGEYGCFKVIVKLETGKKGEKKKGKEKHSTLLEVVTS